MSLSSLIVQREIATIRQVEEALARQVLYGGDLATNLLEVARLDEATLTSLLAESFGMTPATLGPLPIPTERARALVPVEMAQARAVMPLSVEGDSLVVAVAEPLPKEVEEELTFALGLQVSARIAPMVRVREAIARAYGAPLERRLQRLLTRLAAPPAPPVHLSSMPPPESPPMVVQGGRGEVPLPAPPASRPGAVAVLARSSRPTVAIPSRGGPPSRPALTETSESARATLLNKGAAAQRPPRRRRGPITHDAARRELDEADTRDAILDLFFDYARQYFDYSALFVVQADIAEGREAYGDGASRDRVQAIGVPLDLPSVLSMARDARAAVRVAPDTDGLDPVLLGDLERSTKGEVLVVPVVVRKRAVALLYGDSGDEGVEPAGAKEVVAYAGLVGQAFERLIVRKKVQGALAHAPRPSLPATVVPVAPPPVMVATPVVVAPEPEEPPPPTMPSPTPPPPKGRPDEEDLFPLEDPIPLLEQRRIDDRRTPVKDSPLLRPPPEPEVEIGPESELSLEGTDGAAEAAAPRAQADDRPPPPTAAAVRRPSGPPIPREEPNDSDRPAPGSGPRSPVPAAPPSESFAVAPHRPPSSHVGDSEPLPSVIVDVDSELGALVDRVMTQGGDEAAEHDLLRQGRHAMPAIMARFPGPTVVDRARVEDGSLRVADCGPVLRMIAGQRRVALPFVLPLLGDGDPERRYWATFLLTELAYPEAVEPLVPRLFEADHAVRRVARLAARAIADVAPEAIMERLVRYYRDPSLPVERRIEMVETLGELRERLAFPLLIEALSDPEELVAAAARRALMVVARQDLGRDPRKWQSWWAQNAGRHRIEWLIDALMHEVPAIRRAAGDEIKATTKEYFGYYDDLPRKEREKSQQRYREWWANEGRARFLRR